LAALALTLGAATAQNDRVAAPALPVDLSALTKVTSPPADPAPPPKALPVSEAKESREDKSAPTEPISDYSTQIGNGLKERERRLTLLNEAMMKLREAGEMEDASHVELRIRALLEMPAPSQGDAKLRTEIEQLRNKNDELALQIVSLQEDLKRAKAVPVTNSRRVASNSER